MAGPLDEITGSMAIPFADVGNPIMAQVGSPSSLRQKIQIEGLSLSA